MHSIISSSNTIISTLSLVTLVSNDHSSLRAEFLLTSFSQLCGRSSKAVSVPIEHYTLTFASRALAWLYPLAPPATSPKTSDEAPRSIFNIAPVVFTHYRLDSFCCFIRMVEGDCANVVMQNVCLDDSVE